MADTAQSGYTTAAAVFVPISVLILTLTKPDYGAEFWRIFRYESYLAPFYAKRGLLVCFLLLSIVVSSRIRWNDRGMFLLCLIIGFAVTSWEALTTLSPPNTFEGGGWFVGWWTEPMHAGWGVISHNIEQYIPPDYRTAARIGVSLYPFLAAFLLLFPSSRQVPKDFVRDLREELPVYLFLGVLVGLSGWAFWAVTRGSAHGAGTKFLLGVLSIPAVVALIALVLTSIIWIPAVLFFLPAFLFWVLSQPFKVVYFLVVKGPVMVLHNLHYMLVPHPLEDVIRQHDEVQARRGAVDYASSARKMAKARYNGLREGLPAWWQSPNWEKRLKDKMALRGRVQSETNVADEDMEEFRTHHRDSKE
jgi:hypothetical protein